MLDAVYMDALEEKHIVAIKVQPAFRSLLETLTAREEIGIALNRI